jgi:hypothetical protein
LISTARTHVYAVELQAGVEVVFQLTQGEAIIVELANPDATSISNDAYTIPFIDYVKTLPWQALFTPAVDGTYLFILSTQQSGMVYTVTVLEERISKRINDVDNFPGYPSASDLAKHFVSKLKDATINRYTNMSEQWQKDEAFKLGRSTLAWKNKLMDAIGQGTQSPSSPKK